MPGVLLESWNLVRVYGTWVTPDGATMLSGTYTITIPGRLTNSTDDRIIPAGTFASGQLNTTPGSGASLDIMVPATDDPDIEQDDWKLVITVKFSGAAQEIYEIDVPVANRPSADGGNGAGVNLRQIALSAQITPQIALYGVGVPGGLARLSTDGLAVLNANGDPITGTGGTGGSSTWPVAGTPSPLAGLSSTANATNVRDAIQAAAATDLTALSTTVAAKADSTTVNTALASKADVTTVNSLTATVSTKADASSVVPNSRTVNGKALSANITLSAGDVSAVPTTRTVAGKALSGDVTLVASDVGAVATTGAETIAGVKTFSSTPVLPAANPTTSTQAAHKGYVDSKTNPTLPWIYDTTAAAWPTLPGTAPTGVILVEAIGPVAPTSAQVPNWPGVTFMYRATV
jgi:hypothetical protein